MRLQTEELDIESDPIKELTVTQMRKDKKEKYYENVLKKLDKLPFEGIEGISRPPTTYVFTNSR